MKTGPRTGFRWTPETIVYAITQAGQDPVAYRRALLGKSVGDMYAGAFIPGITLAGLGAEVAKTPWPCSPDRARAGSWRSISFMTVSPSSREVVTSHAGLSGPCSACPSRSVATIPGRIS